MKKKWEWILYQCKFGEKFKESTQEVNLKGKRFWNIEREIFSRLVEKNVFKIKNVLLTTSKCELLSLNYLTHNTILKYQENINNNRHLRLKWLRENYRKISTVPRDNLILYWLVFLVCFHETSLCFVHAVWNDSKLWSCWFEVNKWVRIWKKMWYIIKTFMTLIE